MSRGWPGWAKGGSEAVTMTAAMLRGCIVTPWGSMHAELLQHGRARLWPVKGACVVWSPGAVQTHDQAVAGQRVGAHAGDGGDFLDARSLGWRDRAPAP